MGPALGTRPAQHQRPVGTVSQLGCIEGHWQAQRGEERTPRCLKNIQNHAAQAQLPRSPCLVCKLVWVPLVHRLGREQESVVLSHLAGGAGLHTQEQAHSRTSQYSVSGLRALLADQADE